MSQYYNVPRKRNIFDPASKEPYKISRSAIDLFVECPRCFYLDKRLGVKRPPGYPFNLNSAVDELLKREFDAHRKECTKHPLMGAYGIEAVPYEHADIDKWRENFTGVQYVHPDTNFLVSGAIDDVWVNDAGELIVADYKATSKNEEVTIDAPWQDSYKRQMEVYQWLLRRNGFDVSRTGYFVYANASRDKEAFDGKLEFDIKVIPYEGSDDWIDQTLRDMRATLELEQPPAADEDCDYCNYRAAVGEVVRTARNRANGANGQLFNG